MLVKSMLVPLVEATAVPEVIPSTAPELIVTLAEPSIIVDKIYSPFIRDLQILDATYLLPI
jgi:hypothetical protein